MCKKVNGPQPMQLPTYPCTKCDDVAICTSCKTCTRWVAWNQAISKLGTEYVATRMNEAEKAERRAAARGIEECPCNECAGMPCLQEADGKGSCFAYCAWKVGVGVELPDMLDTAVDILRARVAWYREAYQAGCLEGSEDGSRPLDFYTAYVVYDTVLEIVEAVANGDQGTLMHYEEMEESDNG